MVLVHGMLGLEDDKVLVHGMQEQGDGRALVDDMQEQGHREKMHYQRQQIEGTSSLSCLYPPASDHGLQNYQGLQMNRL